jgi:hypothetical protein
MEMIGVPLQTLTAPLARNVILSTMLTKSQEEDKTMKIVVIVLIVFFCAAVFTMLKAASKAEDHAETMRDSKEEK